MEIRQLLKKYWGYDNFRPYQENIIRNVLNRQDVLVLMPTGGGKSICYQLPAVASPGTAIVISPLISLMKDQVESLRSAGINAAFYNSSLTSSEQAQIEKNCLDGKIKILYVSPEKIVTAWFISFLRRIEISLFAIDEAHCVSFWGHDFRPEYKQIQKLRDDFREVPFIALTATADKLTRKDIISQLSLRNPEVFISSFDRPNLSLSVLPGRNRLKQISAFIGRRKNESGIIYCLSRKNCEELSEKLRKEGLNVDYYHAGLDNATRARVQEEFIRDDVQIICATIAFGMGIDKPNVRWVIHYNLPKNIENFYQEIGRAGRDGLKSDTLLFYTYQDYIIHHDMLKEVAPARKELQEAKLDRMKQYAEADICRRKILLSYFNETTDKDCGNCDVCKNPPRKINGTIIAQKALSAIARADEKVALTMLVNILRGSMNRDLLEKGYNNLKTFGAGRDLRFEEWSDYILQMLNSGLVDIAYDEAHVFRLNEVSRQILKGEKEIQLVRFIPLSERKAAGAPVVEEKSAAELNDERLTDRLKKLRKSLADYIEVPAYVIFNDATLREIVKHKPVTPYELKTIQGIGDEKLKRYGEDILNEIIAFLQEDKGKKPAGDTYRETFTMLNQGHSIETIAAGRNLNTVTIFSHLAYLYEKGFDVDLKKYITQQEYDEITVAIKKVGISENKIKPVFDFLNGKFEYHKIRLAATLLGKSK
jgi:ATP-dependent DNA helicase RecQ